MVLTVNGVDMTPYIAYNGVKWQRYDVEAPDAGRTLDALMHRGRVATKIRLDVTCKPLTDSQVSTVLNAIYPEFVSVTYTDPQAGGTVTKTMYSNNNPATYLLHKEGQEDLWNGITFPLVER